VPVYIVGLVHGVDDPSTAMTARPSSLAGSLANLAEWTGGRVIVSWARRDGHVEITVADEGPGLANTANLFVPFFTTKPGGSGIGLVLSRQIAEAHGGSLELANRAGTRGCEARLRLPG